VCVHKRTPLARFWRLTLPYMDLYQGLLIFSSDDEPVHFFPLLEAHFFRQKVTCRLHLGLEPPLKYSVSTLLKLSGRWNQSLHSDWRCGTTQVRTRFTTRDLESTANLLGETLRIELEISSGRAIVGFGLDALTYYTPPGNQCFPNSLLLLVLGLRFASW
jgi:hypothetical protein